MLLVIAGAPLLVPCGLCNAVALVMGTVGHFVTDDKRISPFDTYNLFYREGLGIDVAALAAAE